MFIGVVSFTLLDFLSYFTLYSSSFLLLLLLLLLVCALRFFRRDVCLSTFYVIVFVLFVLFLYESERDYSKPYFCFAKSKFFFFNLVLVLRPSSFV